MCRYFLVDRNSGKAAPGTLAKVCSSAAAASAAPAGGALGAAACSLRKDMATCSRSVALAVRNTCSGNKPMLVDTFVEICRVVFAGNGRGWTT